MKVVVDAGSGMAGKIVPILFSKLPIKIIKQDFKLDGRFPIHEANPLKHAHLDHLAKRIKKEKADFGIAFDADMDRVFFVDEKGDLVNASELASLLIKNLYKGKKIVYNSICSWIVPETIKETKSKGFLEKVGHSYIKKKMKKEKITFGCEHSGHYYFKDNDYADSGIITSFLICEIFSKFNGKFSEMVKEFRRYHKAEEKNVKMKNKNEIKKAFKKVENHYNKLKPKKISKFDGLKIEFEDYWIGLRESNTESLIRINLEAKSKKRTNEELKKLTKIVKN